VRHVRRLTVSIYFVLVYCVFFFPIRIYQWWWIKIFNSINYKIQILNSTVTITQSCSVYWRRGTCASVQRVCLLVRPSRRARCRWCRRNLRRWRLSWTWRHAAQCSLTTSRPSAAGHPTYDLRSVHSHRPTCTLIRTHDSKISYTRIIYAQTAYLN